MCYKILFILLLYCISVGNGNFVNVGPKTFDNFGPYNIAITHFEKCNGPKSRNLAYYDVTMQKNNSQFVFNITNYDSASVDEIRITVFSLKDNHKKVLWSYKLNKPCQHFLIANTIENIVSAKNCSVKKQKYDVVIDYVEYTHIFFGTSFFYGEYLIKSVVTSTKGNLFCIIMNFVFTKK